MNEYKITAKRKQNCSPFVDQNGSVLWDGRSKTITLSVGDEFVTKMMFGRMKEYTDPKIWQLKLVKV